MRKVDMHQLQELLRLHRKGETARSVARKVGISPNTERRYRRALEAAGLLTGSADDLPGMAELKRAVDLHLPESRPPQHLSSVEPWSATIESKLRAGARPKAIFDWLRQECPDFSGSHSAVKRLCRRLVKEKGIVAKDVVIPVQTDPGDVAQVDFGSIGKKWDPQTKSLRRAYVFVMTLGHSRHMFARIVFDQKVGTWLQLHVDAFQYFGGVPRTLVPDNLKAAVIRTAYGTQRGPVLNRSYRELARHYDFIIDPTPPRAPEKKGKVESNIKYVKSNFFASRADELDAGILQQQLDHWVVEVAGQRIHGTTRWRPLERFFEVEHAALRKLPKQAWEPVVWSEPKLHRDCHANVAGALYSAPWRLVGKRLMARATTSSVELYSDDIRVATHSRVPAGRRQTQEEHLPEKRRDFRHRTREYWEERADTLGEDVGKYIREVFDSDDVLSQLRTVQQIVTMLGDIPPHRAQAACRRASYFGSYSYRSVKSILNKALDFQPLPNAVVPQRGGLDQPRFARDIRDLLQIPIEKTDAPN